MRSLLLSILMLATCFGWAQPSDSVVTQSRLHASLRFGPSYFIGDVQGNRGQNAFGRFWKNQRFGEISGSLRYRFPESSFSYEISLGLVQLAGADSLSDFPSIVGRNLSFRNRVIEHAHFIGMDLFHTASETDGSKWAFTGRVAMGAGIIYSNPQALYQGRWIALQPLNTEGLGRDYSRFQPVMPLVLTVEMIKGPFTIGLSGNYRMTFTDYLDDVSSFYPDPGGLSSDLAMALSNRSAEADDNPLSIGSENFTTGAIRGNQRNNDHYFTATLSLGMTLGKPSSR